MNFEEWKRTDKINATASRRHSEGQAKREKRVWNAALDEAVKVADELYKHHYDHSRQKQGAMDAAKAIKELKE